MYDKSRDKDTDLSQTLTQSESKGKGSPTFKQDKNINQSYDDREGTVVIMVGNEQEELRDTITDETESETEYGLCKGLYVLFLFCVISGFSLWTKGAMAQFYGYSGAGGKAGDPFYSMKLVVNGLNAQSYAQYVGLWFSLTFIPSLLLGGPLIDNLKKTNVLGWCTALSGVTTVLHAFVTDMWQAQVLMALNGLFQGLSVSI